MGKFAVTTTVVKGTDTVGKFEKKVKKALEDNGLDAKKVAKLLDELDKKEGVWSSGTSDEEKQKNFEKCCELRERLEEASDGAEE